MVDANIVFAALIRNSSARSLIFRYPSELLAPEYILQELQKYSHYLFHKSGMPEGEFQALLELVLRRITVVPRAQLLQHASDAWKICKDLDPDDQMYFACALAYPGSIIWSEDKALKRQSSIPVLNTAEMFELL